VVGLGFMGHGLAVPQQPELRRHRRGSLVAAATYAARAKTAGSSNSQ
jgi:hypothetical protein